MVPGEVAAGWRLGHPGPFLRLTEAPGFEGFQANQAAGSLGITLQLANAV